jgi:hypothetical protein
MSGCEGPLRPSRDSETAQRIGVLLARLRLHCPFRQEYTQEQAKLVIEDMIRDLAPEGAPAVDAACEAWRKGGSPWFPTSGQLIEKIEEGREASIAHARASQPAYRAIEDSSGKWAYQHRPWRDILREHGRPIPPDDSPMAQALDKLQTPPLREMWAKDAGNA